MYLEPNGDLILGLHDLDHVLGDPKHLGAYLQGESFAGKTGSEAFLSIFDESEELFLNGLQSDGFRSDIRQQLAAIGAKRIVLTLDPGIVAGPGITLLATSLKLPGSIPQADGTSFQGFTSDREGEVLEALLPYVRGAADEATLRRVEVLRHAAAADGLLAEWDRVYQDAVRFSLAG